MRDCPPTSAASLGLHVCPALSPGRPDTLFMAKGCNLTTFSAFQSEHDAIGAGVNDGQRAALLVLGAEGKRLTYRKGCGASAA